MTNGVSVGIISVVPPGLGRRLVRTAYPGMNSGVTIRSPSGTRGLFVKLAPMRSRGAGRDERLGSPRTTADCNSQFRLLNFFSDVVFSSAISLLSFFLPALSLSRFRASWYHASALSGSPFCR